MKEAGVRLPVDYPKKLVSQIPLTADTLCHTYADRVYKFGRLISMDAGDAEDLAQDALERAIRGLKTFNPAKGGVEGWLWRIVVNRVATPVGSRAGNASSLSCSLTDGRQMKTSWISAASSRATKCSTRCGPCLAAIARF